MSDDREAWASVVFRSHTAAIARVLTSLQAGDQADALFGLACLVEAMSRSEANAIAARMRLIAAHMYKIMISPDNTAFNHWSHEITVWRDEIEDAVEQHPSFKNLLDGFAARIRVKNIADRVYRLLGLPVPRSSQLPALTADDILTADLDALRATWRDRRG